MEIVNYRVEITKEEVGNKILVEIPKFKLAFTVRNESEIERKANFMINCALSDIDFGNVTHPLL